MKIADLTLLSGVDIPFPELGLAIHQPIIKEIALIGEDNFFTGCEMLRFSKDILIDQDKINLSSKSNFDVLMMILNDKSAEITPKLDSVLMVLTIIFPGYDIQILNDKIILIGNGLVYEINNNNFEQFKNIISEIFCFSRLVSTKEDYNPVDDLAKSIMEKLKKGRAKVAAVSNKPNKKISILTRYISILTVASNKSMRELLMYTVPQIFDEFNRYQLKRAYDINMQARMAGASKLDDPEDWTKDLYE